MLTKLAIDNASLLRRLADPHPIESAAALAKELNRDKSNVSKSLKALRDAGLIEKRDGWPVDAVTKAGEEMIAALDRADGKGAAVAAGAMPQGYALIPHALIVPDPLNPRKEFDEEALEELAASIGKDDLLENLVVRPLGPLDGHLQPVHRLVAGERRWRAIGKLIAKGAWPVDRGIPCLVKDMDDATHARIAIIENLQRKDLKPLDEARGFKRLREEFGLTTADIAEQISATQRFVQQRLQLLDLNDADMKALDKGDINIEEARRRLAAYPTPLSAKAKLAIAEFMEKLKRDPVKGGYGDTGVEVRATTIREEKNGYTGVTVKIDDPAITDLVKRYILQRPERIYEEGIETGRHKLCLWYSGRDALKRELPEAADDKKRKKLIEELRIGILGAAKAAEIPEGTYATPWLNGPFETSADALAEIEKARQRRLERDAEIKRQDEERKASEKAKRAELQRRVKVAAEAEVKLREGIAAGAESLTAVVPSLLTELTAPAPWFMKPDGDIVSAEGKRVLDMPYYGTLSEQDLPRRRLLVALVNAAAGVETPAKAPAEIDEDAISREEFIDLIADALQEDAWEDLDPAIAAEVKEREAAVKRATAGLDAFLAQEEIEYADAAYDWEEGGAESIAEGILYNDLGREAGTNDVREDAGETEAPATDEAAGDAAGSDDDPELTPSLKRLAGVRTEKEPELEGAD